MASLSLSCRMPDAVLRHHAACGLVAFAVPVVLPVMEVQAEAVGDGIEHPQAFRDDLVADTVSWDDGERVLHTLGHRNLLRSDGFSGGRQLFQDFDQLGHRGSRIGLHADRQRLQNRRGRIVEAV